MHNYDWLKHASAQLTDDDVEKAFADQAFSAMSTRASKLFQQPYFLGFEMVFANEDKTRLVGIFAFRANRELLYAPVFFLNGTIKGTELLYRVRPKMFVPLTEEWITYLVEKDTPTPGHDLPRSRVDGLLTGTDMTPVIYPRRVKSGGWTPEPSMEPAQTPVGGATEDEMDNYLVRFGTPEQRAAAQQAIDQRVLAAGAEAQRPFNQKLVAQEQAAQQQASDARGMAAPQTAVSRAPLINAPAPTFSNPTPQAAPPQVAATPAAPTPTLPTPGAGGGISAANLAAFRKSHGGTFDPNSKMDRWKMEQLGRGNTTAGNKDFRRSAPTFAKAARLDEWQPLMAEWESGKASFAPMGLIKKFLIEDGGVKCANEIAEMIKSSAEFAEAFMNCCDGEISNGLPEELFRIKPGDVQPTCTVIKTASARPKLAIHFGGIKNAHINSPERFEQSIKRGFLIEDNRADDETSKVFEMESDWETIGMEGVYEVPLLDGSAGKALVAPEVELTGIGGDDGKCEVACATPGGKYTRPKSLMMLFTSPTSTVTRMEEPKALGKADPEARKVQDEIGTHAPSVGKAYAIFDSENGGMTSAYLVLDTKKRKGQGTIVTMASVSSWGVSTYRSIEVLINDDAPECDFKSGILNKGARFVQVDLEKIERSKNEPTPMAESCDGYHVQDVRLVRAPKLLPASLTMDALISAGMRFAKVSLRASDKMLTVDVTGRKRASMYAPGAAELYLAAHIGIPAEIAAQLVTDAVTKHEAQICFEPVKSAAAVSRINDRPDFTPDYDPLFATAVETPKSYALLAETNAPQIREIPLNETYDPALGGSGNQDRNHQADEQESMALTKSPAELKQWQKARNLPSVFEHGVVGSLVKTFDATAMVDKYLPAMEAGLDRTGRLVFLVYWKPQDLEEAYGSDDMADLESELVSNFKSYGALVLNLLKRSKNADLGTPALR